MQQLQLANSQEWRPAVCSMEELDVWTCPPFQHRPDNLGYGMTLTFDDLPTTAAHTGPRIAPPAPCVCRGVSRATTFSAAARCDRWSKRLIVVESIGQERLRRRHDHWLRLIGRRLIWRRVGL